MKGRAPSKSQYKAYVEKVLLALAKDKARAETFISQVKALRRKHSKFDSLPVLQDLQLSLLEPPPDPEVERYDKARKKAEKAIQKHLERYEKLKEELQKNLAVEKVTEVLSLKVPITKWKKPPPGWRSRILDWHNDKLVQKVFKDGKFVFPWEVGRPGKKKRNGFIVSGTDYLRDSGLLEEEALRIVKEAIEIFWGEYIDEGALRTVYYREKSKKQKAN